ncbi:hypothetical protein BU15DRAFT_62796 [Melanogaster broomeanus]|nr:hypothetical protein BU15DRAFT_62796 [Melanogaster broomeanus]
MAKKGKITLPNIAWDADDHALIWKLIDEIIKPANYKVLCGKLDKAENTSKETKASVFWRIGSVLLPDFYSLDGTATGDRVKGKYEWLVKTYKHYAKRLLVTGEGITDADEFEAGGDEVCNFFIDAAGPDGHTPEAAKNICNDIKSQFPFFPELHRIWAAKPNKNPIAITTGVGPGGKKTLYMQPLASPKTTDPIARGEGDDAFEFTELQYSEIWTLQDALNIAKTRQNTTPSLETDGGKENLATSWPSSQPALSTLQHTAPKSSSLSQDSISKAKDHIQKVPKKRTIEDTLMAIHKNNTDSLNARAHEELMVKKCQLLLEEFKAGVWDVETYREELLKLEGGECPAKQARQYSPHWDLD